MSKLLSLNSLKKVYLSISVKHLVFIWLRKNLEGPATILMKTCSYSLEGG